MRDRFLLRADVEGFTYRDILEVRPGRVRLIRPSDPLRRSLRMGTIAVALIWLVVVNPLVLLGGNALFAGLQWPDWLALALMGTVWVVGVVVATILWDSHTLPILADNTQNTVDLKILGVTSFWTFQELRASAPQGELRLTVQGSQKRMNRALRFAGGGVATGV